MLGEFGGRGLWGKSEAHTDVPSLRHENAQREEEEEHACAYPSVRHERRRLVEVGLEYLPNVSLKFNTSPLPSSQIQLLCCKTEDPTASFQNYHVPVRTSSFAPSRPRKGYPAPERPCLRVCRRCSWGFRSFGVGTGDSDVRIRGGKGK